MECEMKDAWKCLFVKFSIWAALYLLITGVLPLLPKHMPTFMAFIVGTGMIVFLVFAQSMEFSRLIQDVVEEAKEEAVRDE